MNYTQLRLLGIALFVVGAILLFIGSTSIVVFLFYGLIAMSGGALVAYAEKTRDRRPS